MLQQPQAALLAAQNALGSWWRNVLPALLPFFILTEFLSRCGFIRALSIWLEPIMQPLFRLPGAAALGIILGFFAGSPTGGAIAGQLRSQQLISRNEGERLTAFCNNAGPLYVMITAEPAFGPAAALFRAKKKFAPTSDTIRSAVNSLRLASSFRPPNQSAALKPNAQGKFI